ncbi:type VI secretion system tube protein TssD [Taibaiella soli]|uniref:Type VI secretion system needle protein Hcp n=1 Tax=Taibaiella soli TaxID=1649169 RepID=A0A2W2BH80_9BACT|nr:type VI secretion system tube protein TssD [Taibaiella soli]PZF72846.1 hypothetical protein DN068_10555 [Taibaiella soli]
MSSFNAELIIDGQVYRLRHCSFECRQNINDDGRPKSAVLGGIVSLILENPAPKEILQWVANPNDRKDGEVRFYEVNSSVGTHQVLEFTEAFCVHFCNTFDGEQHQSGALISSFVISARTLSLNGVSTQQ